MPLAVSAVRMASASFFKYSGLFSSGRVLSHFPSRIANVLRFENSVWSSKTMLCSSAKITPDKNVTAKRARRVRGSTLLLPSGIFRKKFLRIIGKFLAQLCTVPLIVMVNAPPDQAGWLCRFHVHNQPTDVALHAASFA